jgi:hypothetical protein
MKSFNYAKFSAIFLTHIFAGGRQQRGEGGGSDFIQQYNSGEVIENRKSQA